MPSPPPNHRPSAAALSPFGRNSQNAALLAKANKSGIPPPSSPSSSSNKQAPATPKSSKSSGLGNGSNTGGDGNRSISLSSRPSPLPSNRSPFASPTNPGSFAGRTSSRYDSTGLLSREFETTHHRQCRMLLMTFIAAANTWEEIATFDGLKWAKEAVEGWEDLYAAKKLGQRDASATRQAKGPTASSTLRAEDKKQALALDPKQAHDPILGPGGLRESRMADAVRRIEAAHIGLRTVSGKLDKALQKLTTSSDSLHSLLEEVSQRQGFKSAFKTPMWATWPLYRFADRATEIEKQYRMATMHFEVLIPILLESGEPPASRTTRNDDFDDDQATDMRSNERRAAYQEWSSLSYVEKRGPQSLPGLEMLCQVEVARWRE